MEKKTTSQTGMAGHLAVMSELIHLGYNAVLPSFDVGSDLFVINEQAGELTHRVQVKTAKGKLRPDGVTAALFQVPRDQLRTPKRVELFYVFALRKEPGYDYVVLSRVELLGLRKDYEKTSRREAESDSYGLTLYFTAEEVTGWQHSFQKYRNHFGGYFPRVTTVPEASEEAPAPSSDPER